MITIWWYESQNRALPEGGDESEVSTSRIDLDIIESDAYNVEADVTAHTVEQGVPISDHIMPKQDTAMATIVVSSRQSTGLFVEDTRGGTVQLGEGLEALGMIVPEGTDRIGDVHSTLRRLCREGVEVDVDGLVRPIEGWVIKSVSSPRTTDTAGTLVCDVVFTEIRYAFVEEVDAPSPRVERGRRRRDNGRQPAEEASDEDASSSADNRTQALRALNWLGVDPLASYAQ